MKLLLYIPPDLSARLYGAAYAEPSVAALFHQSGLPESHCKKGVWILSDRVPAEPEDR